jgi:large subunit ribosomal protein L5
MARLKDLYKSKIVPELVKEFDYKNPMAVPRMVKIVISMGVGKATQDKKFLELARKDLMMITGQLPLVCKAKKSVSNFKLREGNEIGLKVTVRHKRMGLAEQSVFPEINPAKVEFQQGMNIAFITTANTDEEAKKMLALFGMPFRESATQEP